MQKKFLKKCCTVERGYSHAAQRAALKMLYVSNNMLGDAVKLYVVFYNFYS